LGVGAVSVSSPSHYRRSILGRRKAGADESARPLTVFDAIRQLMAPPEPKKKRGIGFTAHIEQ
jgi:hypothetical protein